MTLFKPGTGKSISNRRWEVFRKAFQAKLKELASQHSVEPPLVQARPLRGFTLAFCYGNSAVVINEKRIKRKMTEMMFTLKQASDLAEILAVHEFQHYLDALSGQWPRFQFLTRYQVKRTEDTKEQRAERAVRTEFGKCESDLLTELGMIEWVNAWAVRPSGQRRLWPAQDGLDFARETGDRQAEVGSLVDLGDMHLEWRDFQKAEQYLLEALNICQEAGDIKWHGHCLVTLGSVHLGTWKLAEAQWYYREAIEIFQRTHDRPLEGTALYQLGTALLASGQYEQAESCFQQALTIFRETKEPIGETFALLNSIRAHLSLGEYEQAQGLVRPMVPDLDIQRNKLFADIYQHFCSTYSKRHQRYPELWDPTVLMDLALVSGEINEAMHRYIEAKEFYKIAAAVGEKLGITEGQRAAELVTALVAASLVSQGRTLLKLKQVSEAFETFKGALEIAQGDLMLQARALSGQALTFLEQRKLSKALRRSSRAVTLIQALEGGREDPTVHYHHFRVLRARGRVKEAKQQLKQAYEEIMRRAKRIRDPKRRESFLSNVNSNREIIEAWEREANVIESELDS